jgi:flagellar protein FlbD
MVKVTRLNGSEFFINPELIQFIEETPDTVITLTNHDKIVVKEPVQEIIKKVIEYARMVRCFGELTQGGEGK